MESARPHRATPASRASAAERERQEADERARRHQQAAARARSRAAARERQTSEQAVLACSGSQLPPDRYLDREIAGCGSPSGSWS